MFYVYTIYTRPLSVQAQYSRSCPIICSLRYNSSLNTWTVLHLTATKFTPLIFLYFPQEQGNTVIFPGIARHRFHKRCLVPVTWERIYLSYLGMALSSLSTILAFRCPIKICIVRDPYKILMCSDVILIINTSIGPIETVLDINTKTLFLFGPELLITAPEWCYQTVSLCMLNKKKKIGWHLSWSWSHVTTDGQSASTRLGAHCRIFDQILILSEICCLVSVGRPLWREVGSVSCQSLSTVLLHCTVLYFFYMSHVFCIYIYRPSQPRLSTAEHTPSFVAYTTTAVKTLQRSYAWPPPNSSPLNSLRRGSPCHILRI
jgi:hypothetical protein